MATDLQWCDFIIWSPKRMLIQRVFADNYWNTETSLELIAFYHRYLTRCEDIHPSQQLAHWTNVDLKRIFYLNNIADTRLREIFIFSLATHLTRWIIPYRDVDITLARWLKLINSEFDMAVKKICRTCLLKLFKMKYNASPHVKDNEPIVRFFNSECDIPGFIMSAARNLLMEIEVDAKILPTPCLCLKS